MAEAIDAKINHLVRGAPLIAKGWKDKTIESYDSKWAKFLTFCDEDNHDPFQASEVDAVAYTGWLFCKSKIEPRSIANYNSVINSRHRVPGL